MKRPKIKNLGLYRGTVPPPSRDGEKSLLFKDTKFLSFGK